MTHGRWFLLIILLGILVMAVVVRATGLAAYYFSPDDLLHLEIASGRDLSEVLANGAEHMHPPLILVLLHYLIRNRMP